MGFSNQERINMNSKALAAAVIDANPIAQWYESRNAFSFLIEGSSVLTDFASVPIAANLTTARNNATANPTIISDLSQPASAIRLTAVAGTNNSTWIAYSTYNDTSSAVLNNWIQPQLKPQTTGAASIGYAIVLYDGDPNAGGTEVTTTDGTTGSGASKTVGWFFQYSTGLLLLSDDFKSSVSDPYIMGFRYIGSTANTAASTNSTQQNFVADETIAIGDVLRLVSSSDVGLTPGRAIKAISTSEATGQVIGVARSSGNQGDNISVILSGMADVKFGAAPLSTDNGKTVYLASASGEGVLTPPSTGAIVKLGKLSGGDGSDSTPTIVLNIDFVAEIA